MKRTLLIGAALLAFGCGRNGQQPQTATSSAATSNDSGAASSTSAPSASGTAAANATQAVTLVGCLRGPAVPGATGTAGSAAGDRARARGTGNQAADAEMHGAAANARYTLSDARVESGGVGANGAGGSGGPLVSPGSDVQLDGVPADAQTNVNKQVRVTGRIDSRPAGAAGAAGAATTNPANAGTSGSGVGTPSGMGSAGAAGSPSGGSTSTRDDVRANSTTVASGENGNPAARRVTVESVQVVAQSCGSASR